jgi:hypothetical protein
VITLNGVRADLDQSRNYLIREPVLVNSIAKAQDLIDLAHQLERPVEAFDIAM